MFKSVLKVNLYSLKALFFRQSKNKKQRSPISRILIGCLVAFLFLYLGVATGFLFFGLGSILADVQNNQLYLSFAFTAATMVCFISGIFTVYSQVFDSKDNDLLLSMPIPPSYILAGRTFTLLVLNYIFESLIMIPAIIVYCILWDISILSMVMFVILSLLLPLPVIALSYVVGFIINAIASRVRNKSIMVTILSFSFLVAYMYYAPQLSNFITYLGENASEVANVFKTVLVPVYYYSSAVLDLTLFSLFMYLLYAIIPFAIVYAIMSYKFIGVITTKRSFAKIVYEDKPVKQNSITKTLIMREIKHFVSLPSYMVNSALGIVFTILLPVFLLIKYDDLTAITEVINSMGLPGVNANTLLSCGCIVLLCLLCTTDTISAPSISLEGNTIWLLQSLPVSGYDILMSKVYTHIIICLPFSIIAGTLFNIIFPTSIFITIMMYITPTVMTIFQALLGLWANLKFPRTDFINETAAVKQSISVLIAMFGSMAVVTVPLVLYIAVLGNYFSCELYILLFTVFLALLSLCMYLYIRKRGSEIFADIN